MHGKPPIQHLRGFALTYFRLVAELHIGSESPQRSPCPWTPEVKQENQPIAGMIAGTVASASCRSFIWKEGQNRLHLACDLASVSAYVMQQAPSIGRAIVQRRVYPRLGQRKSGLGHVAVEGAAVSAVRVYD